MSTHKIPGTRYRTGTKNEYTIYDDGSKVYKYSRRRQMTTTKPKTYKDCKEFPLVNFERIESTGDFFYMVKGYEAGDEIEADPEQMKDLFNSVVQDYVISLNAKNYDIVQYGKINSAKVDLLKFYVAKQIIELQITANHYKSTVGLKIDNSIIDELLKDLRIQKKEDLSEQCEIIERKIDKLNNDISEAEKKIEKNEPKDKQGEADINEMITNVEMILERGIDMQKTSLYRFGIMQDQARKKIEHLNKSQK